MIPSTPRAASRFIRFGSFTVHVTTFKLWRRASAINFTWRLSPAFAVLFGVLAYLALTTVGNVSTEFLYFNF